MSAEPPWTWRYDAPGTTGGGDPEAATSAVDGPPSAPVFPTQADAESWLGEEWRALLEGGVEAVHLFEGDRHVYGPMSLRPAS